MIHTGNINLVNENKTAGVYTENFNDEIYRRILLLHPLSLFDLLLGFTICPFLK